MPDVVLSSLTMLTAGVPVGVTVISATESDSGNVATIPMLFLTVSGVQIMLLLQGVAVNFVTGLAL